MPQDYHKNECFNLQFVCNAIKSRKQETYDVQIQLPVILSSFNDSSCDPMPQIIKFDWQTNFDLWDGL